MNRSLVLGFVLGAGTVFVLTRVPAEPVAGAPVSAPDTPPKAPDPRV